MPPNSIVIVISNPLDAMVTLCQKITGFPYNRVIGQAGVLDSARFATFIAWELGVSVKDVNAMTLGGHGDDMVPLVRYASVNGIPVMELLEKKYKCRKRPRKSWKPWSSAPVAPAAKLLPCSRPVLHSTPRLLPPLPWLSRSSRIRSVFCRPAASCKGEFGVKGYYVGVPAVLGEKGVEKILQFKLDAEEQAMMDKSVAAVKDLVDSMK